MFACPERAAARRVAATACVLLLAASAAPAAAQDVPTPGERWSTAGTVDFQVLGQAPARRVEQIARDLALTRAGLLLIAGAPDHQAPYPTTVLVFRDDATLLAYHRQADGSPPAGPLLAALDRQGRLLALSLEGLERDLPRAREILAGDLVDQLLVRPPGWLRTGLAGLGARLEPTGGPNQAARLVERLPPAATVTAWPEPGALRAAKKGEHREAAIGLVRHLANPRSERSSQLHRYLTLLRGGLPADAAFEECFFAPFESIYTEVAQVAARGGSPTIELEPRAPTSTASREPSYEEVACALGDLLLRAVPWNTVAAELHFRAVLDRRPHDAGALRGVAQARELDGRRDDAAEIWERSLAAAPDDRATAMLYGWSRLERFRQSVGTRRGWEEPLPAEVAAARDLFVRAFTVRETGSGARQEHAGPGSEHAGSPSAPPVPPSRSNPAESDAAPATHAHDLGPPIAPEASPYALHGFAATFLYARDRFEPAIAALERATRLLPGDDEMAADLVLLHAHGSNHFLAWELRRERLLDRVAPALDAEIEKLLVEESLQAADRFLLVEEKPDSAIGLVRRAATEVRDAATRQELERLLGQMEQVAEELARSALFDRFVAAYEEAKRLAVERRTDEARALLEPFAADDMDPVVRDPARDALRQLDQLAPRR
jgi:tetratricopeptide (TPR) repeat protein